MIMEGQPQIQPAIPPRVAVDISTATVQQLARLNDNIENLMSELSDTSGQVQNAAYSLSVLCLGFEIMAQEAKKTGKYGAIYDFASFVRKAAKRINAEIKAEGGAEDDEEGDEEEVDDL